MKPKPVEKTAAEISAIILKLLNRRISLPEYAMMGEKNWALIDRQVHILRHKPPRKEIDAMCAKESAAFKVGIEEAYLWLEGKITDFDLLGGNM